LRDRRNGLFSRDGDPRPRRVPFLRRRWNRNAGARLCSIMARYFEVLEGLPIAVCATDAEGFLTFYNDAAAELWGRRPELGRERWSGALRLFHPDGRPMPRDECPMAVTLREGKPVRGAEAIAERPDGRRVGFLPFPSLIRDDEGRIAGAINVMIDVTERREAHLAQARLAAIVSSSDDAIISKTLDGTVTSWNAGATRIFGYEPEEMIGQPIYRIVPPELRSEEDSILARLRRGERIDHCDTERVGRDGRRLSISLTVSPIRNAAGEIVGASKTARDVTERKRAEEHQRLLLSELNHRVKNTLATIQAIARQSLRAEPSPGAFVASFAGRIQALARAHDLLVRGEMQRAELADLVRSQVDLGAPDPRIRASGPAVVLDSRTAAQLGLVLHELATNARKHGALSVPEGRLAITWSTDMAPEPALLVEWRETGVRGVRVPTKQGFGTLLIERSLLANRGRAAIGYRDTGIDCEIRLPLPGLPLPGTAPAAASAEGGSTEPDGDDLAGRRILVVEDEPLIAMDVEERLLAAGCSVIGPAANPATAQRLIAESAPDAALLDSNLAGHSVGVLAAELRRRGIPFAFATGVGRDSLPEGFEEAPLLAKPFGTAELLAMVRSLLAGRTSRVVPFRPHG
jgi:PAS domain S-box-containing protein